MLSPDARAVAIDVLRPPAGYRLDRTVLTTYSLDLEVLLALPLAVLAHADGGVERLLEDPLLLLEAMREAGERVQVFVDEAGIAIPRTSRALYASLEPSVHPVRAPNGGAFHPKVWIARFLMPGQPPLLRVAVASRNLTFDRSWDVALVSEATTGGKRPIAETRPLGQLVRALPGLSTRGIDPLLESALTDLAGELENTRFPAPKDFNECVTFHGFGLAAGRQTPWKPLPQATRILAIAPFASRTALDALKDTGASETTLVSRSEALDELSEGVLDSWSEVLALSDMATDEPDDETASRPSGLHAKLIGIEYGYKVTWFVGSANLTAAAFTGQNVEMMAAITGPKGIPGGKTGFGIDRFRESGFLNLCEPYRRTEPPERDAALQRAQQALEEAKNRLVASELKVVCRPKEDTWEWVLEGAITLPADVKVSMWPVSVSEDLARDLELPSVWSLPTSRLTAFAAFRLHVEADVSDVRLALKLPVEGMPEGRINQVLRTLIDSPERFLQFMRALLGGFDGLMDWAAGTGSGAGSWGAGFDRETLLEDLVRTASREPARLDPIRRLVTDLRATAEGREIIPDDLHAIWQVVDAAARKGGGK
ncbi:MAG: phospholipase D family protein [Aquisalimonadaceae bacterium]